VVRGGATTRASPGGTGDDPQPLWEDFHTKEGDVVA
jgi:hypothetical protein